MPRVDTQFKERVYELVARIPEGRVMTYGQIAALCGAAYAAWEVGQLAHFGSKELPWQRVVNKQGGLASAYTWGSLEGHKQALEAEGVVVDENYKVDIGTFLWFPPSH